MHVRLEATGAPVGAVVEVDLARDPAPDIVHSLLRALMEHHVLLFRGQALSEARLVEVSAWFGPVYRPPAGIPMLGGEEQPAVVTLSNAEAGGVAGSEPLPMHSDLHNMPFPADLSVLYAVDVPPAGGETSWSNLHQAYDELEPEQRAELAGVRASSPNPYAGGARAPARHAAGPNQMYVEEEIAAFSHPVVRTHPVTGRRSLYVGHYVDRLIGVEPAARSDEVLARLKAHVDQPHLYWTHRWRAGDLVISDNRCTNHKRAPLAPGARRTLWRMTLGGSRPF
jgi:taurine dioxygenase